MTDFSLALVERLPARYQKTAKQFIKFSITGTVGAIVDFSSYNLLTRGFAWDTVYSILGNEIIAANLVSVALAILSNFILNKYWTFRNPSKAVIQQGTGYFALNSITFIFNQFLTGFFAFNVPIIATIFSSQKDNVAKALSIGIILFFNFIGSKFLVFRRKPLTTQTSSQSTSR